MNKGAAYWMDLRYFDDEDPLFLAQVQRGITNFVKILTGKDIPVEYATTGDSMTDGKTVYISANLKENTIDYIVGLALHEASHILLTDFGYLNKEKGSVLKNVYKIPKEDIDNVFTLVNFIEDKRIDNYVYTTAPGYQFYYEKLYHKSFNACYMLGSIFVIFLLFVKYNFKLYFKKLLVEHILFMLGIGLYEYWFFSNIVIKFNPLSSEETNYLISSCGYSYFNKKNNIFRYNINCDL